MAAWKAVSDLLLFSCGCSAASYNQLQQLVFIICIHSSSLQGIHVVSLVQRILWHSPCHFTYIYSIQLEPSYIYFLTALSFKMHVFICKKPDKNIQVVLVPHLPGVVEWSSREYWIKLSGEGLAQHSQHSRLETVQWVAQEALFLNLYEVGYRLAGQQAPDRLCYNFKAKLNTQGKRLKIMLKMCDF